MTAQAAVALITEGTAAGVNGDPVALAFANFSNGVRMALSDPEVGLRLAIGAEELVRGEAHLTTEKVDAAVEIARQMFETLG